MLQGSLRASRDLLMSDSTLTGNQFCRRLSDETDSWLSMIAERAAGKSERRLALVAVGGYGRRELCPFSDLDLVLIHEGRRDIKEVADALWYPVWDEGVRVDHAVRRPKEVLKAAGGDLRVALGLLDARVIWGDSRVAEPVIEKVRHLWRNSISQEFIPSLETQMRERHRLEGDVAFLLEPNLKEAHGGLRDVSVLRALSSCAPRLADLVDLDVINRAAATLTSVRVELHRTSGRALDRMLLQEQDSVAAALGYRDADELCHAVSEAGRSIARLSDEIWRRRTMWAPGKNQNYEFDNARLDVEAGIVITNGEVGLSPSAEVATDSSLIWRVAAVGAERDLPISLGAVHRLADRTPPAPSPWPEGVLQSLIRLLLCGHRAIPAFETLDHLGLVTHLMPEWEHVRHHHQRNAYHRFTVDRHLLETAANAAGLAETVDRQDLLVIGALLHDIGKGLPGDHTDVGIEIVGSLAPRMGFNEADVHILQDLVRHHLLLADTATRRDLSDPATIERVAELVGDRTTLAVLGALTKADSLATGSSAWGSWKEQLVNDLVRRTDALLAGATTPAPSNELSEEHRALVDSVLTTSEPALLLAPPTVVVAAPDRPGLLAQVTGVLALHGLGVQSADAMSTDGVAIETFTVDAAIGLWPTHEDLRHVLGEVLALRVDLTVLLENREETYSGARRTWSAHPIIPSVTVDNDESAQATILEVRAADQLGLLHRLTSVLFECDLDVTAARVSTIGGEVVDAFYVRDQSGAKLDDDAQIERVLSELRMIISGGEGDRAS